jgi:hypothetical protein
MTLLGVDSIIEAGPIGQPAFGRSFDFQVKEIEVFEISK